MNTYDFRNLSHADFEDLARDLIGKEMGLGLRPSLKVLMVEWMVDILRGADLIVLQAKHYAGSTFSTLKNRMNREKEALHKLNTPRYILVTSHPLTPLKKKKLIEVCGSELLCEHDIWGPGRKWDIHKPAITCRTPIK
ncbi:hypothetical protein [Hahella ganghwensis]|uniref:hypothetical protein n=1 Tax=Hahella ganghwensis TaxID=286420 RepID=UPI000477280E|nr:hypothetical protein [Hahella ganghwensis]